MTWFNLFWEYYKSEIVCSVFFYHTVIRLGVMSPTDVSPKWKFLNEVSRYDPSLAGRGGGGIGAVVMLYVGLVYYCKGRMWSIYYILLYCTVHGRSTVYAFEF